MNEALILRTNKLKQLSREAVVSTVHLGNPIKPLDMYTGEG